MVDYRLDDCSSQREQGGRRPSGTGGQAVIPPKRNRTSKRRCDAELYKERNIIERLVRGSQPVPPRWSTRKPQACVGINGSMCFSRCHARRYRPSGDQIS